MVRPEGWTSILAITILTGLSTQVISVISVIKR
jgi:hypothetical protein